MSPTVLLKEGQDDEGGKNFPFSYFINWLTDILPNDFPTELIDKFF